MPPRVIALQKVQSQLKGDLFLLKALFNIEEGLGDRSSAIDHPIQLLYKHNLSSRCLQSRFGLALYLPAFYLAQGLCGKAPDIFPDAAGPIIRRVKNSNT